MPVARQTCALSLPLLDGAPFSVPCSQSSALLSSSLRRDPGGLCLGRIWLGGSVLSPLVSHPRLQVSLPPDCAPPPPRRPSQSTAVFTAHRHSVRILWLGSISNCSCIVSFLYWVTELSKTRGKSSGVHALCVSSRKRTQSGDS